MANRDTVISMKPQTVTSTFLSHILGTVICVCVALLGWQL